ncbi:hypothetical protein D3C73_1542690 [compost metagenome]
MTGGRNQAMAATRAMTQPSPSEISVVCTGEISQAPAAVCLASRVPPTATRGTIRAGTNRAFFQRAALA